MLKEQDVYIFYFISNGVVMRLWAVCEAELPAALQVGGLDLLCWWAPWGQRMLWRMYLGSSEGNWANRPGLLKL